MNLEGHLQCDLTNARIARSVDRTHLRIPIVVFGIVEVGAVECIERLSTEIDIKPFTNNEMPFERQIGSERARSRDDSGSRIPAGVLGGSRECRRIKPMADRSLILRAGCRRLLYGSAAVFLHQRNSTHSCCSRQ